MMLPLRDNNGNPFPESQFESVRKELADNFGGVTAFMRAPAKGLWETDGQLVQDDVVIFEVMVDHLEREFWRLYRLELEKTFRQEQILIRAHKIEML
ncbi:MAG TPA: hypothetical protein VM100_02175 [Longimicrobiales bacterium]|nr:hypothetical protein [Longimicrobiales bacterium]